MHTGHTLTAHRLGAPTVTLPRLSRQAGFWVVAFAFFVVTALSTAPSALYGLYGQSEHIAPITITFVYASYAVGVVASLMLAGHVSDWYGRRVVLIPALIVAAASAVVFVSWQSLTGLIVARLLTGVALGAAVATSNAYLADLGAGPDGGVTRRAQIVATIATVGGLAGGPFVAGLLARYEAHGLTLPYIVLLVALAVGIIGVLLAPEGHPAARPLPHYHPQQLKVPERTRSQFLAAITGVGLAFATWGLFAGLAGRFLAGPLGHPSPALTGLAIFLNFGSGLAAQIATQSWSGHRQLVTGIPTVIFGLVILVASAWTAPPSLALFLIGGAVTGAGAGAIYRASLAIVVASSGPNDRAGALAIFFVAGYAALSLPVLGLGVALQFLTPRVTLLIFGLIVALGLAALAPSLVRKPAAD